jgi:predicted HicB family RNase H-like nuclease
MSRVSDAMRNRRRDTIPPMPAKHEPGSPYSGKILLRLPPELHETIARLAMRDERSVNAEIVWALREFAKAQEKKK